MRRQMTMLFSDMPAWEREIRAGLADSYALTSAAFDQKDLATFNVVVPLVASDTEHLPRRFHSSQDVNALFPTAETLAHCEDTLAFNWLATNGIGQHVPRIGRKFDYPYFVKARRGQWGVGIEIVRDSLDTPRIFSCGRGPSVSGAMAASCHPGGVTEAELLAHAGNHTFGSLLAQFLAAQAPDLAAFWTVYGSTGPRSRASYLDRQQALAAVAQRWPGPFVASLATAPGAWDGEIMRMLGGIDSPGARDILVGAVQTDDPGTAARPAALSALARLGDPRLSDLLVTLLGVENLRERAIVAGLEPYAYLLAGAWLELAPV